MNRPRRFAGIDTTLTAFACAIVVLAMLACEPTPTPTPVPSPTPSGTPTPVPTATATPTSDEPAPTFVLDALQTVFGYWQDGTADVELSIELRNDGDTPAQRSPIVTVECALDGEMLSGCGGPLDNLVLPGGVGREEATLRLRAPMGTELRAVLDDGTVSNTVVVPERILGTQRDTWECFSDRPRRDASYENDFLGGCGGWTSGTVLKWDPEEPVRVWADPSGDARHVLILEETLSGLAPLLNLDIEWVEAEAEATLRAYVGVPSTRAADLGLEDFCQDATGCARPDSYEDGRITSASMSVWLNGPQGALLTENEIAHATLHEALHALAAMHHRPAVRSVMSVNAELRLPSLSESDEALLRLHAHPLVQPGMTMPQVQRLIVFADELLDPSPATASGDRGILLAESAYAALLDAGSARFDVRGGWPDRGCERTFAGTHALGRFADGYPALVRFDGSPGDVVLAYTETTGWRGWRRMSGGWEKGSLERVYEATPWRLAFTDPVEMLLNVIAHAEPGGISVTRTSEGTVVLDATLRYVPPVAWARSVVLRVGITLDAGTHRISAYDLHWSFDAIDSGACARYEVSATNGEYGPDVSLPSAISGR